MLDRIAVDRLARSLAARPAAQCRGAVDFQSDSPVSRLSSPVSRAFTLIELLVVIAIISFVVALGIPLFGVLTGAKSVEAGRNVVAAALGQARTIAVNEGKFAGVMFYVDPATERTAMSVVVVSDPASSLDDPDPYDKYKTWVAGQQYEGGGVDAATKQNVRRDRVISMAADADATYRGELYNKMPLVSSYLSSIPNYRPTVRAYRATQTHDAQDINNNRPPRNGPYGTYTGTAPIPQQYNRTPNNNATPASSAPPPPESANGPFANDNWNADERREITRYSTGEQQLLPSGVGVQVIVQPIATATASPERYLRTGVVMFDPQGRLVSRDVELSNTDTLGAALQLDDPARKIYAGVGVVLYDGQAFRSQGYSQADWAYANRSSGNLAMIVAKPINPSLNDFPRPDAPNQNAAFNTTNGEVTEEQWLDNNTTPLLINRYSGSLSEAD